MFIKSEFNEHLKEGNLTSLLITDVQRHESGYFLDKKVGTSIPIIVLGQESGYFFIKELL
ncbi:hypothetical protein FC694_07555 [Bacillus wiedmannii]|uniref:Uncharacterized protein n=1 Tax=Bacillus wiedmannii TaxID=1890302 RepID=A0A4U2N3A0_9BACI|nr:hypothetical protein FC694_07555 [Bacillus wiedmannii]